MVKDTERQTYRGVACLHCKKPIPIPLSVASIEADLQADETSPPRHRKCQVFNLRCVACGKEKPYKIGEILEFEGVPVTGMPRAELSSAYLRPLGDRPRVANA